MPSTVIAAFSYDAAAHMLLITFLSGRVYGYKGVGEQLYEGMRKARSKGSYFNRYIRDRYDYIRMA